MKKILFKRIMSLVLVVVMAVSTMAVSAVSSSAATTDGKNYTYKITIKTGDKEQAGTSSRIDLFPYDKDGNCMNTITFYGEQMSAEFGQNGICSCTYTCENEIDTIGAGISTVRIFDNWNLEYIKIEQMYDGAVYKTKTFKYDKWVLDSIAYRDPDPEKYCVFPESTNTTFPGEKLTYKLSFQTAGSLGKSNNKFSIKVNGDDGSTGWHDVGYIANAKTDSASFDDIDVGNIQSITVKKCLYDGWYPEYINVTKGDKTTTIYGGRWIDDKNEEFTLSVTDKVAKVTIKTSDTLNAGTDCPVYIQLFDRNFYDSDCLTSDRINLSDIHPKSNAFEQNDLATFYILVPEEFSEVSRIKMVAMASEVDNWSLDYIDVTFNGETDRYYDSKTTSGASICFHNNMIKSLYRTGDIYKVTVKTSDKFLAGTDNDVKLKTYDFFDDYIRSFTLDNSKDNFERNDTDVFYITSSSEIYSIKISIEGNSGTDWNLEYVQLDRLDISKGEETVVESVRYNYNRWLEVMPDYWLDDIDDGYSPTDVEVLMYKN